MTDAIVVVLDRLLSPLTAIGLWIQRIEVAAISAIAGILVVSTGWGVFSRYFLNRPLPWPEELGVFLYIWMTLVGAAVVLRRRAHIDIAFLSARMSFFWRTLVDLAMHLLILIFLIIVIWNCLDTIGAEHTLQFGAALRWPKSFLMASLLFAAVSMALTCIQIILQYVRDLLRPPADADTSGREELSAQL